MSFLGMNVGEVQSLAGQMQQAASELTSVIGRITSALDGAQWVGPDRDRFVSEWQTLHAQALNGVANGLTQAAHICTLQAQKQVEASQ